MDQKWLDKLTHWFIKSFSNKFCNKINFLYGKHLDKRKNNLCFLVYVWTYKNTLTCFSDQLAHEFCGPGVRVDQGTI